MRKIYLDDFFPLNEHDGTATSKSQANFTFKQAHHRSLESTVMESLKTLEDKRTKNRARKDGNTQRYGCRLIDYYDRAIAHHAFFLSHARLSLLLESHPDLVKQYPWLSESTSAINFPSQSDQERRRIEHERLRADWYQAQTQQLQQQLQQLQQQLHHRPMQTGVKPEPITIESKKESWPTRNEQEVADHLASLSLKAEDLNPAKRFVKSEQQWKRIEAGESKPFVEQ